MALGDGAEVDLGFVVEQRHRAILGVQGEAGPGRGRGRGRGSCRCDAECAAGLDLDAQGIFQHREGVRIEADGRVRGRAVDVRDQAVRREAGVAAVGRLDLVDGGLGRGAMLRGLLGQHELEARAHGGGGEAGLVHGAEM